MALLRRRLRRTDASPDALSREQRDALTGCGIDPASVTIDGATAEAGHGPVPEALRGILDASPGSIRLRREGDEWRIDSPPF